MSTFTDVLQSSAYSSPNSGLYSLIINNTSGITADNSSASNVGLGLGVFKQEVGDNLEFRSLIAGSSRLKFFNNPNDITFDVIENVLDVSNMIGGVDIVYLTSNQNLTNKTIDSTTNVVKADKLTTTTGSVVVSGASAPNAGDLLTATSGTVADWASPSARQRYGCYYISTPITTNVVAVNTFYKVAGTSTACVLSNSMYMSADNRLLYNGLSTRIFKLDVTLTGSVVSGNKSLEFIVYKNGSTPITATSQTVYFSINKDNNTSLTMVLSVVTGDFFEVWVRNLDDSTDVLVSSLNVNMHNVD